MRTNQSEREEEEFNLLVDELEQEWRKTQPRMTERDWVALFSPPKEMILGKITEWKERRGDIVRRIKSALKENRALDVDEFSQWFGERIIRLYLEPELMECNRQLRRLSGILQILDPQPLKRDHQLEIERARQYPIQELTRGKLEFRGKGKSSSSLCPFHQEKHPSFYIYPKSNSYHCFGCQEHGDVIKLTMHLYGLSFREAVQMLQQ